MMTNDTDELPKKPSSVNRTRLILTSPPDRLSFLVLSAVRSSELSHHIYTSGSTGEPKAVSVSHGALLSYAWEKARVHRVDVTSRVMVASAHTWDPCLGDIGSTLAVAATPEELPALRTVALGGESFTLHAVKPWLSAGVQAAMSAHGVTEAAVYQTALPLNSLRLSEWRDHVSLPAGFPFRGVRLALAGEPVGEAPTASRWSELLVGGEQLAEGYFNRPELTHAKFVRLRRDQASLKVSVSAQLRLLASDQPEECAGEEMWFRTGDLAEWSEETGLTLLGRIDDQVKLRGIRVELGEVEAAARTSPLVSAAAASVVEGSLALYVRCSGGGGATAVRLTLGRLLPLALQPSHVVALQQLPLTPGGKLLRSQLPHPPAAPRRRRGYQRQFGWEGREDGRNEGEWERRDGDNERGETGENEEERGEGAERARSEEWRMRGGGGRIGRGASWSASPTELIVASAWEEALGVEGVGPDDHFWELGGSSLSAVRMLRLLAAPLRAAHGGDAFERGNQRFATRLCGLYR
ncbi:MAG: hypothetical protein SGPRY_005990 [Prymnesium sp.]